MGTWGAAIFADDFACDVRRDYLEKLASGEAPADASRALIEEYGAEGEQVDTDEGPLFWLALAATQWEYGALDDVVRARALALCDGGEDSPLWTEAGPNRKRAAVLAALARKLRMPPPRLRRPRKRKPLEAEYRTVASPDGSAVASVSSHQDFTQVVIEIATLGGGGGIFAAYCGIDEVQLRWKDDATLEVSYPATAHTVSEGPIGSRDQFYLRGRVIQLEFTKRGA